MPTLMSTSAAFDYVSSRLQPVLSALLERRPCEARMVRAGVVAVTDGQRLYPDGVNVALRDALGGHLVANLDALYPDYGAETDTRERYRATTARCLLVEIRTFFTLDPSWHAREGRQHEGALICCAHPECCEALEAAERCASTDFVTRPRAHLPAGEAFIIHGLPNEGYPGSDHSIGG